MADNTLMEDDDDEMVVIETDEMPAQAEAESEAVEDEEEDARFNEDAEDDPDGDTEISSVRRKRQKRRKVQKIAREAAQRELQLLRAQNDAMAKRLAAVEGNALSHNEFALDSRIGEAETSIRNAEHIIARAIEAGNGDDVATAMRMRDEALVRVQQLKTAKQQVLDARNRPAPNDPAAVTLAQEWMRENPWYDVKGGDEDSAITNAIDARLVAEGYNPASVDYWEELTRRVRTRINDEPPQRNATAPESTKKKAPPMGNSREYAPPSTKKEVYVTPERKQAMIDAGIWENPVRRNQMIKAYQAYDRNSAR